MKEENIDYEKILDKLSIEKNGIVIPRDEFLTEYLHKAMDATVRECVPIHVDAILKEVSEKARMSGEFYVDDNGFRSYRFTDIDKQSILSMRDEIISKLTK